MSGPAVPDAPTVRDRSQWRASSPAEMVRLPLSMFSCCSAFTASFTGASMFRVSSRMVRLAAPSSSVVAPDLTPFLPLAVTFRVPEPHRVT